MPALSKKQQMAAGMALAMKRGDMPVTSGTPAAQMAKSMSSDQVKEFASTPRKGLPNKKKGGKGKDYSFSK
jgi:hypothetical protein